EGVVLGVVQVMADADGIYTPADLELLEGVSLLLAGALENARLSRGGAPPPGARGSSPPRSRPSCPTPSTRSATPSSCCAAAALRTPRRGGHRTSSSARSSTSRA